MKQLQTTFDTGSIAPLRSQIDELDDAIINLLQRRMRVASQIGSLKQSSGMSIQDSTRETAIISKIDSRLFDSKIKTSLSSIYQEIFRQSRHVQELDVMPNLTSTFQSVAVIGLGLIGGALARQIRTKHPRVHVRAFDSDCLADASEQGVVDTICKDLAETVADAQLIILAAPPKANLELLKQIAPLAQRGQLIVDVTSTKTEICQLAEDITLEADFIGGHPLFGSEKSGFLNSKDVSVDGKTFVITPTSNSSETARKRLFNWLTELGLKVEITDAVQHDATLAVTSHLVQLVAVALGNTLAKTNANSRLNEKARLSGPAFRSFTRLMASPAKLWLEILQSNKKHVVQAIEALQEELNQLREAIIDGDGNKVEELFGGSAAVKRALD